MKTLADMTPQERAQCRGMWCEEKDGFMCIYMGADATPEQTGVFAYPASMNAMRTFLNRVIPRPDLPRAWAADGQPPAGQWQRLSDPHFQQEQRRWVGEWE